MRVLARVKCNIQVMSSDTISLSYTHPDGRKETVLSLPTGKTMLVKEALVIEPDEGDCLQLGISGGIGGLFATRD